VSVSYVAGPAQGTVVIYVPGMDQTKEVFPKASHNIALSRGFHVLAMDGPGQGNSNMQKIRAVGDNYERAGAAVISYLMKRPEVDKRKIAIYGISMGSYWSLRLSSYDHRAAAVVSSVACFNPNNTIFTQSSPRFKQMFMYMAGYDDEDKFDVEVARGMTVRGYLDKINCPTLLVTGEFDPLCPLEDAVEAYEDLQVPKEMWVFENQYHPLWGIANLGGMDCHDYVLDWLQGVFSGKRMPRKTGARRLYQGAWRWALGQVRVDAADKARAGVLLGRDFEREPAARRITANEVMRPLDAL
jgi:pimeloyl-ACP methyl ester carboxylesterase